MTPERWRFWPVALAVLLTLLPAVAQKKSPPLTARQRKQKDQQLRKELEGPWHRWLTDDVGYIITDEEKNAFGKLQTDDEREQFVEQFWLRRDPSPDTVENEFKEEHYRRIAYANEHFASGIPGWKADRGRIYITYGAPDEIDSHASGGSYQRPASEGGGQTSAYPFETWRYRHLDGVGEDINIEFVDRTMTGEYRFTIDADEKDALLHVPGGAANTPSNAPPGSTPASMNQFTRLELQANLMRPPAVKFKDLEVAIDSRITFNVLPMQVRVDYVRVTDSSVLANITVEFEYKDLQFTGNDGMRKSLLNLQGRITGITGRRVSSFEKQLEIPVAAELLPKLTSERSVYQESVPLVPGRYKLNVAAKDVVAGTLNTVEIALDVPHFEEDKLGSSSLILADLLEKLPSRSIGGAMFAIGDTKVRPRVGQRFRRDEKMGIYLQLYNFSQDEKTRKPAGDVSYEVLKAGSNEKLIDFSQDISTIPNASPFLVTVEQWLPLKNMSPGVYTLKVQATDRATKQSVQKQTNFTVD